MKEVRDSISFPSLEEEILAFWDREQIFEKSLERTRAMGNSYVFYDGPPFATGLPHYGHLLAGTLKDIIPRYWTMKGRHVERRFGWDCHGLPVEFEIERELDLKGKQDIEDYGIAKFNAACRSVVLRYTDEWKKTVRRIGRWVDTENDYKTMDMPYMESIWWVFRTMWDKGLIYKGSKVLPYSCRIGTPLSHFEANLNYKDVQDPSITISFPVRGQDDTHLLAWTTTPWTLTSNLALAVGPDVDYVKVRDSASGKNFILAAARLGAYYKKEEEREILAEMKGSDLTGLEYEPLFAYFAAQPGAFRVIEAAFVSTGDGTGIVHMAPAFGEDDYFACRAAGIDIVMPVDQNGCFTDEVPDFKGRYIKDADKDIIRAIKDRGRLIHQGTIMHSYPFCYRSDTPLIYKAISTWFVAVEKIKDQIIANNSGVHWVPEHIKDGRFGKWLDGARDWAISRNRFWGTPIPVWTDESGEELLCVGSIAELEELTGRKVEDLHRDTLDDFEIVSPETGRRLRRVPEVLDCWFESGSMPYAQNHYPFENKDKFESKFPADFIAEGLDQTRGWFYTLLVVSTALFGDTSYRNVVVNGLILAEDGKKMSKRLKNYPAPDEVLNKYGADALRLYMINSPVVRAEELRFSEAGVKDLVRRVLLPLWNSYKFFVTYAIIDKWKPRADGSPARSENILDRWIVSRMQSMIKQVNAEMDSYHLYSVVPVLLEFINELTDCYIRLNRRRFWLEGDSADKDSAYGALYYVLVEFAKMLAPFAPFITEEIYRNLASLADGGRPSVHMEDFPDFAPELIDRELEDGVERLMQILIMGRNVRNQKQIKVKIPLKRLQVIHKDESVLGEIRALETYMRSELNVREIEYCANEDDFVRLYAKPNFRALGPRFGKEFKAVQKKIEAMDGAQLAELESAGRIVLDGIELGPDDVQVFREVRDESSVWSNRFISISLDCTVDEDQKLEGYSRELVSAVQKLRKDSGLRVEDRISVRCAPDATFARVLELHKDAVCAETLCESLETAGAAGDFRCVIEIDGAKIEVGLSRN